MKRKLLSLIAASAFSLTACGQKPAGSNVDVTDVPQTSVKRQSIGNCWAYAVVGWIESLHLAATGNDINISESYISYWSFFDQLKSEHHDAEVQTGGTWSMARDIILTKGFLFEGEFAPGEEDEQMSAVQDQAEAYINEQLQDGGALHGSETRTDANIIKHLNIAFNVDMASLINKAKPASQLVVGRGGVTLENALNSNGYAWNEIRFPQSYGEDAISEDVRIERVGLLRRVLRALNDKQPVIMSVMIDFNGLDVNDATFKLDLLREMGPGKIGGHMVVLEDYVVDNVPGIGRINEGEVSDELKEKALEGDLVYLKAKNSWGTNRPDRGLTDGYTSFNTDYLMDNYEWNSWGKSSAIMDFVLPPNY